MLKFLNKKALMMGAALTMGANSQAHAGDGGNDFSTIAENITTSIQDLPGLLSALSYLFGLLLGVLGILKIKDHVENPQQAHLKEGAIRLAAGGALFALPIVFEAMLSTVGEGDAVNAPSLNRVEFGVGGG